MKLLEYPKWYSLLVGDMDRKELGRPTMIPNHKDQLIVICFVGTIPFFCLSSIPPPLTYSFSSKPHRGLILTSIFRNLAGQI